MAAQRNSLVRSSSLALLMITILAGRQKDVQIIPRLLSTKFSSKGHGKMIAQFRGTIHLTCTLGPRWILAAIYGVRVVA